MNSWMKYLLLGGLLSLGYACKRTQPPVVTFAECTVPAPPDYSLAEHWVAHPEKVDEADGTPGNTVKNRQDEAEVDVFFIYPTIFKDEEAWNEDLSDEELNKQIATSTIRHQASIFNGSGRIFAPYYRQMTYCGFFYETQEQKRDMVQAFTLAYQDVRAAFEYYLTEENQGRPFIIASHSQGSGHAIHLLKDFVDGKALADQMVAAYIPGWPVPADTFQTLQPCSDPSATGCFNTWYTFAEDYFPPNYEQFYRNAVSVNPVTWSLDSSWSKQEDHRGMVMKGYKKILSERLETRVKGSILWVTKPDVTGKIFLALDNYHIADYNLFWLDIRENVATRVAAYLESRP